MRIKKIEIGGFGKWKNKVIDFDRRFQVIYGNNEAGKSTIYQFIRYVLFDQPSRRSEQNDYAPRGQSLHGGRIVIEHPHHGEVKIERFRAHHKGQARVYFADGSVGDQDGLKELLAPLTLSLFDEVFSLQQEELLKIKGLDEDRLQQLLLSVGVSGSQKIVREQQAFEKAHKHLYRPGGRVRPLNQELAAYRQLEEQISTKEKAERKYRHQVKELVELKERQANEATTLAEHEATCSALEEQVRLWADYQAYEQLSSSLAHEQAEVLSDEQLKQLNELEQEEQFIKEQIDQYQLLKENQLVSGQLSPALMFYQGHQVEIENLADQQPKFMKLQARLEWLTEKVDQDEHELARLSKELGVSSAAELPPLKQGDYHLVQKLANRQTNLSDNLLTTEAALAELEARLEELPASEKGPSYNSAIACGGLTAILAGASVYLGAPQIALVLLIIGVVLCLVLGVQASKAGNSELEQQLHQQLSLISSEVEKNEAEQLAILEQKRELAEQFVFPESLAFNDWLYLWPQREQLSHKEISLEQTQSEQKVLLKDVAIYREHLGIMSEWLPVKTETLEEVYRQLLAFVKEMREKQAQLSADNITNWHEPLKALQEREGQLPAKLAEIVPHKEGMAMRDLPLLLANQAWTVERQRQLKNSVKQLSNVFDLTQTYRLPEIKTTLVEQTKLAQQVTTELAATHERMQHLDFSLRQQEADGTLGQLYQARENLGEEIKSMASEWLDHRLGEQILQDLLNFLGLQHLPRLLATASQYLKVLTLNRYQKCEFVDERLQVINTKAEVFRIRELSTGTRDQLYLAIRLAFIHLHSQEPLSPVIIDDGWLHYDSERKSALFNLLGDFSQTVQVICLSSDEELLAFAKAKEVSLEIL